MKVFFRFLVLSIIAGLVACAPGMPEKKKIDLVWPLPPDEPRIKYVDYFYSSLDLGARSGITEALFGEEKVESFIKPYGVAVDSEERVYVTDLGRVWVIDFKNKTYRFIGDEPGVGRLVLPIGVATSSDGRIFVTDTSLDRVFVYNKEGKTVGAIGETGEFVGASGVAIDEKKGIIYIVDARKHQVNIYSLNNYKKLGVLGKRGSDDGEFNFPTNIAVDKEGRLYVVDTGNFRVQIFDSDGRFLRSFGRVGDTPGSFARPKGIAIDSEGHIYVVDAAFQNFQIFDFEGNILLFVGSGGIEPGQFILPAGIAIDNEDRIYVINQIPPSLQIFEYMGEKWKKRQARAQ
jgi:DNA-binding beta-propeller fold protein YncE